MNVDTGEIGDFKDLMTNARGADAKEQMEKTFGKDKIVPIPDHAVHLMSNWGKKKRLRYAEVLGYGYNTEEAFDIVENKKGQCEEKTLPKEVIPAETPPMEEASEEDLMNSIAEQVADMEGFEGLEEDVKDGMLEGLRE